MDEAKGEAIDEVCREFHEQELFNLRQDIGRWQDQRANFERNSIAAILAIWTFAAGYVQTETADFVSVFIWWIPVVACWFTMRRIESYENTINQVTEYLKVVYLKISDKNLQGWMRWRDANLAKFPNKAGQTKTTKTMWRLMFFLCTLVAIMATMSLDSQGLRESFEF